MNTLFSRNHWSQLKNLIKQDLAGVTDADLKACRGSRDRLVEKLQEIYGISSEEADGAVAYYEQRLNLWYDSAARRAIN
jgi:hypothetical protein